MTSPSAAALPLVPPLAFYETRTANVEGPPGSLIDSLELNAPPGVRAWAVLYRSAGVGGSTVGVSGLVVAPMFIVAEAMFALGWYRPLLDEIERRVGPTVLRDLAKIA